MYKLISIDLDGTLLNSEKVVPLENKKAIQYALSKGVKVVICSGRVYKGARVFAKEINVKGPLISCNGAVIRNTENDEALYTNLLGKEDCYKIIDVCHQEGIYFHAYIDNDMFTEKAECPSASYWKGNSELPHEDKVKRNAVKDFREIVKASETLVSKFVVISKDFDVLKQVRKRLENVSTVDIMSSHYDNFEVVNKGVNKGNALKYLSEKLNIHPHEIMAIGDNENDWAMLEFAGFKVAMGNAEEKIKDIADYITLSNDENGVAEVIKKFVL